MQSRPANAPISLPPRLHTPPTSSPATPTPPNMMAPLRANPTMTPSLFTSSNMGMPMMGMLPATFTTPNLFPTATSSRLMKMPQASSSSQSQSQPSTPHQQPRDDMMLSLSQVATGNPVISTQPTASTKKRKNTTLTTTTTTTTNHKKRPSSPTSSVSSTASTPTTSRRSAFTSTYSSSLTSMGTAYFPPHMNRMDPIPESDIIEPEPTEDSSKPLDDEDDDDDQSHAHMRKKKHRITDRQRRAKIKDGMEALRGLVHLNSTGKPDQATIISSSVKLVKQLNAEVAALKSQLSSNGISAAPPPIIQLDCQTCKQRELQDKQEGYKQQPPQLELPILEPLPKPIKPEPSLSTLPSFPSFPPSHGRVLSLLTLHRHHHLISSLPTHDPLRLALTAATFMAPPIPGFTPKSYASAQLIDALFLHILSYLTLSDLYATCTLVSCDWLTAAYSPLLWYGIHTVRLDHMPYINQFESVLCPLRNLHQLDIDMESSLAYTQQGLRPKLSLTSTSTHLISNASPSNELSCQPAKISSPCGPPDYMSSILILLSYIIKHCPALTSLHFHHSLYNYYFRESISVYQPQLLASYKNYEYEWIHMFKQVITHTQVQHLYIPHIVSSVILRSLCTHAAPRLLTLAIPTAGLPLYDLTHRDDIMSIASCHSITHLDLSINTHLSTPQLLQLHGHYAMMTQGNVPMNMMMNGNNVTTQQAMQQAGALHLSLLESFTIIAQGLSSLRILKLDGHPIDDMILNIFLEHCHNLQVISIHKCSGITTNAIANAKLMIPNCTILI